jgi:calcium-dependent protein kinase
MKVAVKTIPKSRIAPEGNHLKREIEILGKLDHPNIVKLYEYYEDAKYYHVVLEH